MLRQTSRRGRLDAQLRDLQDKNSGESLQKLATVLASHRPTFQSPPMISSALAQAYASGRTLNHNHYEFLLQYLNATGRVYESAYMETPYTFTNPILPISAQQPKQLLHRSRTYSILTQHEANSHIHFFLPIGNGASSQTGVIEAIWDIVLDGQWQQFLLIRPHRQLSDVQRSQTPYSIEICQLLKTNVVYQDPSQVTIVIEPRHIICHLSVYKRPAGTFGLNFNMLVVNWSLGRGRGQ